MSTSTIAITFKQKKYTGEYAVAEDVLSVLFEDRIKTGVLRGRDAEILARIFLIEMVSEVETARASTAKPVKRRWGQVSRS